MKLNKQMFFAKLDKVSAAGATRLTVAHNAQAVRLTYSLQGADCFDLVMTTRAIPVRDERKERARSLLVHDAAVQFRRWLNEWSAIYGR